MPKLSDTVSAVLLVLLGACATPNRRIGPLATRNQHPAQLTQLQMTPRRAATVPQGELDFRVGLAYSSVFLVDREGGEEVFLDSEQLRVTVKGTYGLSDRLDLDVELPLIHNGPGFMDTFIESFHDTFGFTNQGREAFPRFQYVSRVTTGGDLVYSQDQTALALGDVPVTLTWNLVKPTSKQRFGLSVQGALDLPTGDPDRGMGSGNIDVGIGAVLEWRGDTFGLNAGIQHTFGNTPDRFAVNGFEYQDITTLTFGFQAHLTENFELVSQISYQSAVLDQLDLGAGDDQMFFYTGWRHHLSANTSLEFALGEDAVADVPPDFTAWIGFSHRFGSGGNPK